MINVHDYVNPLGILVYLNMHTDNFALHMCDITNMSTMFEKEG